MTLLFPAHAGMNRLPKVLVAPTLAVPNRRERHRQFYRQSQRRGAARSPVRADAQMGLDSHIAGCIAGRWGDIQ